MNTYRIFAKDCKVSNNSFETHLNNHDILLGGSGVGKSTIVTENLFTTDDNFVCTDVKGVLYKRCAENLRERGYNVKRISFLHPDESSGYDPLHYIRKKKLKDGTYEYNEQDMYSIAYAICPEDSEEPFWGRAAQNFLVCLIGYVLLNFNDEDKNIATVCDLFRLCNIDFNTKSILFLEQFNMKCPDTIVERTYNNSKKLFISEKTWGSVDGILGAHLSRFESSELRRMLSRKADFCFEELGDNKMAVFIEVSDIDRSNDTIINLLYSNILLSLCRKADESKDNMLARHVRFWFDDYASSCNINDMDRLISVLRSRNISVALILQSISQLCSVYGESRSSTICSNVDHILYLGGSDGDQPTVRYIADRAGMLPEDVMALDNEHGMLITRGEKEVRLVEKLNPSQVMQRVHTAKEDFQTVSEPHLF